MRLEAALFALLLAVPAAAQDAGPVAKPAPEKGVPQSAPREPASDVAGQLGDLKVDAEIGALYAACPADIYHTRRSPMTMLFGASGSDRETCEADLGACVDQCRKAHDPDACLSAALVFEAHEDEAGVGKEAGRRLFALACAVGEASGCTNRGGGLRNDMQPTDPLASLPSAALRACLARTFRAACADGDSWGCAMYGQALEEGDEVDPVGAQRAYERACTVAKDEAFAACQYARRQIERLAP